MTMKKLLLTGANGLLGQKIIGRDSLYQTGEVIATARGPFRGASFGKFRYRELDITNRQEVFAVMEEEQPEVVIHTAAMTNVDACESARREAWKVNAEAPGYFAEACEKIGAHLIHLSTDFIFDGTAGPYREEDKPNPLSYYGETKLEAERRIEKMKSPWTIIRTVLVYGVSPGLARSNIVLWAVNALKEGQEIRVVTDQVRSPTLAEDLADGCLLAATQGKEGIYHISGKDQMSIFELVQRVADVFGLDRKLITPSSSDSLNQPARRPPVTGFVIEKAMRELGYKPHSFEEGLKLVKQQLEQLPE